MNLGMGILELEGCLRAGLAGVYVCMSVDMFVYIAIGLAICLAKYHVLSALLIP